MQSVPVANADVKAVIDNYPDELRERILFLRQMIYDVAAQTEGVGELEETLKWGQISYLTPHSKSGTTIRLDATTDPSLGFGMFVHCQTTLVETFRALYGDLLTYEGTRSVKFDLNDDIPVEAMRHCIEMALTYHLDKKRQKKN